MKKAVSEYSRDLWPGSSGLASVLSQVWAVEVLSKYYWKRTQTLLAQLRCQSLVPRTTVSPPVNQCESYCTVFVITQQNLTNRCYREDVKQSHTVRTRAPGPQDSKRWAKFVGFGADVEFFYFREFNRRERSFSQDILYISFSSSEELAHCIGCLCRNCHNWLMVLKSST